MPNFGTRLYEYIFEPLDSPTFDQIVTEIKESVETYIPNLIVTSVTIEPAIVATDSLQFDNNSVNEFTSPILPFGITLNAILFLSFVLLLTGTE